MKTKITYRNWVKTTAFISALSLSGLLMAAPPALSVKGTKIQAGNATASLSGMSLFWSNTGWGGEKYYTAGAVKGVKSFFGGNLVRVAMGVEESGGYLSDREVNLERVYAVVDEAIAQDMYVIIDWHSHYAHEYEREAIAFFEMMARKYGKNNHIIYEVFNEPKNDVTWGQHVKPYAERVIKAIRDIDPDNLIIVGSPTWSQDVDIAANDPIKGFDNIAYTLHFYAGTHGQSLRDKAARAMQKGVALFVTEWGSVNANGDGGIDRVETDKWVAFMKQHTIGNANWALNDKSEGASALRPGASAQGQWSDANLTESGQYVKNLIQTWPGKTTGNGITPVIPDTPVETPVDDQPVETPDTSVSPITCTLGPKGRWGSAFYFSNVQITNISDATLQDWEVKIQFDGPVTLRRSWSASELDSAENTLVMTGTRFNKHLAPGQSTSIRIWGTNSGNIDKTNCTSL